MVVTNLKAIQRVPEAADLLDIVLSQTQRKTPTVVHKGYPIQRIRAFYMRKVRYTQSTFHERLSRILSDFPVVDDVHPFYGDLINVLYDRDHYKLALGQVRRARSLMDAVARDYVRLLKYADSLYRAKSLKRAALGRMGTMAKRLAPCLAYLEQVRQHMARLPSIDPNTRTLLVAGAPNVGKSSFLNSVTRADVDVQPYAFTTQSLFVGHMDYHYLRWQVIDTPGVLDRELEQRNTIEMQAITALAHLRAAVLFFVDPSEQCGYPMAQQLRLFHSLRPLFGDKPLLLVCNKVDLGWEHTLDAETWRAVEAAAADTGAELMKMSATGDVDRESVYAVRNRACERLLEVRVSQRMTQRRSDAVLNRLHVAMPPQTRPPVIPESVWAARQAQREAGAAAAAVPPPRLTEKQREEQMGGAGVYSMDWRKLYDLREPEWRYDIMPEVVDGKNLADYVDADILERLDALERDEEARLTALEAREGMETEEGEEEQRRARAIVRAATERRILRQRRAARERSQNPSVPPARLRSRSVSSRGPARRRPPAVGVLRSLQTTSRPPTAAVALRQVRGVRDMKQAAKARRLFEQSRRKAFASREHRQGEWDRFIAVKKPKHLYAGKMGLGTRHHR